MRRSKSTLNNTVVSVVAAISLVALSAVVFEYSGNIDLRFGSEGIQLKINHSN
ncbi:MAG: hypothetical protein AAF316_15960 [Cyanobacteria bacterium P01_A01_bin.80]